MKLLTKLSLTSAIFAAIGTAAAFADDPQLRNRLALERILNPQGPRTTTVAVYANQHGVGRHLSQDGSTETRFELRSNPHGQQFGVYAPVND